MRLSFCPNGPGGGVDPSCSRSEHAGQLSDRAEKLPGARNPQDLHNAKIKSAAHSAAGAAHFEAYKTLEKSGEPTHEGTRAYMHLAQSRDEDMKAVAALHSVNQGTAVGQKMFMASRYADQKSKEVKDAEKAGGKSFRELGDAHRRAMREHSAAQTTVMKTGSYSKYHNEMRQYHSDKARTYAKLVKLGKHG